MKWTDRFIKLPIKIFDEAENNLTGKEDYECATIETYVKVLTSRIDYYEPTISAEEEFSVENQTCTIVGLQSGKTFLVFMHITEFETLLNNHQK